jgi:hypothetical protein
MKNYNNFINEVWFPNCNIDIVKETDAYGNIILNLDEAKSLIKDIGWKSKKKNIYRGISGAPDIFIYDPKTRTRKSLKIPNYYTLLIDNSPYWKKYPKRSKSVICTTDSDSSSYFGARYIVIPLEDKKWGVCPKHDIWACFSGLIDLGTYHEAVNDLARILKIRIQDEDWKEFADSLNLIGEKLKNYDFKKFDDITKRAIEYAKKKYNKEINRITFGMKYIRIDCFGDNIDVKNILIDDTEEKIYQFYVDLIDSYDIKYHGLVNLYQWHYCNSNVELFFPKKGETVVKHTQKIMKPDENNFELLTYNEIIKKRNTREVWTDNKCLFIKQEIVEDEKL